jgi:AAA family ATP:ADP antiporter
MRSPLASLRALDRAQRIKAALLSGWFFFVITTLWLLKPIRQASLLAHLGSEEIPYVRLGAVVAVAVVVAVYSRIVDRLTRLQLAVGANLFFSALLLLFWAVLTTGGEALGGQRWFVWAVFILVDIYSTVMVGLFWTYANDVVSPREANDLYGPVGLGGIVGGIAGGALVDLLVRVVGHVNLLLLCAALGMVCAVVPTVIERVLRPRPRAKIEEAAGPTAFDGLREVVRSRYLLLLCGVVVGYEFAAAMTDFVVSVVFERTFHGQAELAQMFGRLGWIVSGAALLAQLILVPILLPHKKWALLLAPVTMAIGVLGLALVPVVWMAFLLSISDRGLNYSLQQVAKETLYVPLTDAQKYKAKAFIDMVVDRGGKALSALALMAVIALAGVSVRTSLAAAFAALVLWFFCARALAAAYDRVVASAEQAAPRSTAPASRAPSDVAAAPLAAASTASVEP